MSIKNLFFKKVKLNKEKLQTDQERTKIDIKEYCSKLLELTDNVELWMKGSDINVIRWYAPFFDKSVKYILGGNTNDHYNIPIIRMTNGEKNAELRALSVYSIDGYGCAELTIYNPYRTPNHEKFFLYINNIPKNEKCWMIYRDGHTQDITLTEDSFFTAIESLA